MNKIVDVITRTRDDFVRLEWEDDQGFFGQIDFHMDFRGDWAIDSENMSKDFVKAVLCKMVDDAELELS